MSQIDELIAEHCPNGVQHVAIGDIARTVAGLSGKTKSDFTDGNSRFASYKNIFANPSLNLVSEDFVKVGPGEKQNALRRGDVLITGSSESVEEVGMSAVVTSEPTEPIYVNSFCFIVRFDDPTMFDPDFAKHLFRSLNIRKQIQKCASGVTRINISKPRFLKVMIPVPPLEVQREIVRILDTFSKMEAELEAELEARKQQYEHYRVSLLTSVESAKWSTLGDISSRVSTGATPKAGKPEYYRDGTIPWLRTGEVTFGEVFDTEIKITDQALKETGTSWIKENCVIVAISGATAARSAINKIPLTTNQHCCNLQIDESLANYRFVFFWVSSKYEELKSLGRGARSDLNTKIIKDFPIPVPSLEEQARIVGILDKFDALVNDLGVGLPAELAARRQQYEYYRDKLLTFRELETAS